jgi:hypothetical protein
MYLAARCEETPQSQTLKSGMKMWLNSRNQEQRTTFCWQQDIKHSPAGNTELVTRLSSAMLRHGQTILPTEVSAATVCGGFCWCWGLDWRADNGGNAQSLQTARAKKSELFI